MRYRGRFKVGKRLGGVAGFHDVESSVCEDIHAQRPDEILVFYDQNSLGLFFHKT